MEDSNTPLQNNDDEAPILLSEKERREFLKRASKLAFSAPAMALLLQTGTLKAQYATTIATTITTQSRAPSDRRLKTDILREGTLPNGIALYSFRYRWDAQRFVGVMADEVEAVIPAAVSLHRSGYKMVDYSILFG